MHAHSVGDLSPSQYGSGSCINALSSSTVDVRDQRLSSVSSDIRTSVSDDNSLSGNSNPVQLNQPNANQINISRQNLDQLLNFKKRAECGVQESHNADEIFAVSDWRAPGWEKKSLELAAAGVGRLGNSNY